MKQYNNLKRFSHSQRVVVTQKCLGKEPSSSSFIEVCELSDWFYLLTVEPDKIEKSIRYSVGFSFRMPKYEFWKN